MLLLTKSNSKSCSERNLPGVNGRYFSSHKNETPSYAFCKSNREQRFSRCSTLWPPCRADLNVTLERSTYCHTTLVRDKHAEYTQQPCLLFRMMGFWAVLNSMADCIMNSMADCIRFHHLLPTGKFYPWTLAVAPKITVNSIFTKTTESALRLKMKATRSGEWDGGAMFCPTHQVWTSAGRCWNRSSITLSSARVDVSPRSWSPRAILRRIRRMIFPERVFGKAGAFCTKSGWANGPIFFRTENE